MLFVPVSAFYIWLLFSASIICVSLIYLAKHQHFIQRYHKNVLSGHIQELILLSFVNSALIDWTGCESLLCIRYGVSNARYHISKCSTLNS